MAKTLLGFERIFLGNPKQSRYALSQLSALAEHRGLLGDPVFASRYAELLLDVEDQVAAYTHFADIVKRGETLPPGVSLLKLWGTDTYQRICTLLVELAEEHGSTGLNLEVAAGALTSPRSCLMRFLRQSMGAVLKSEGNHRQERAAPARLTERGECREHAIGARHTHSGDRH